MLFRRVEEGLLPTGIKFRPTEAQLLGHFLYNKAITGAVTEFEAGFVKECDMYGEKDPWEIWNENGGPQQEEEGCQDLWFFTQSKTKDNNPNTCRKSRTVGSGTWSGQDKGVNMYMWDQDSKKRVLLGFRKRFSYKSKPEAPKQKQHDRWIMLEYALNPMLLPPSHPNDYVLCLLRKPLSKKRKQEEEEEGQEEDSYNPVDQGRSAKRVAIHETSTTSDHQYHQHQFLESGGNNQEYPADMLVSCCTLALQEEEEQQHMLEQFPQQVQVGATSDLGETGNSTVDNVSPAAHATTDGGQSAGDASRPLGFDDYLDDFSFESLDAFSVDDLLSGFPGDNPGPAAADHHCLLQPPVDDDLFPDFLEAHLFHEYIAASH